MRVLVKDLVAGQSYAIQFRANTGTEQSEWSQILRLNTSFDIIAPAQVTGLVVDVVDTSFVAHWDAVSTNTDGSELKDFKDYEVIVKSGAQEETYYVTQERFDFPIEVNDSINTSN